MLLTSMEVGTPEHPLQRRVCSADIPYKHIFIGKCPGLPSAWLHERVGGVTGMAKRAFRVQQAR
jgi:hypothetical protein